MTAKRKILMVSDHLLSSSGVGIEGRYLAFGLVDKGHWTIRQLGAAIKHANYDTIKVNEDLMIKPIDGFGNPELLRFVLATERPDVVLLFTDPRFFFDGVWQIEDEIHQVCPIAYWHLWDSVEFPPDFNRPIYESVDLINCINHPTYEFCKSRWPDKTNFIPHSVADIYRPLPEDDCKRYKHQLLNGKCDDHFVAVWVNRNARRKQPGDILLSWKLFLDKLEAAHGHRKATLIMHTDPYDKEGTNLFVVADMLGIKGNVFFSTARFEFEQMNVLFNIADIAVNISSAEGHGIMTHEAMQCGKPIVALAIGGLERQVIDHRDGFEYGVALKPDVTTLSGSQQVPYIADYYVSQEKVADALMKMHEMGPEKRAELGKRAREYVLSEFSMQKMVDDWDRTLSDLIDRWKADRSSVYKPWEARRL